MKTPTRSELDSNIPESVISKRSQGGKELSYLEAWYVIDRLNQIVGQGNWGYGIVSLNKVYEGETEQYSDKAFTTSYTSTVTLFALIDGKHAQFTEVGYGDGTDKKNPGKAHELATKEAVSDALKRAAKNLGRSMGLALYDKTQEFVGEISSKPNSNTTGEMVSTPSSKERGLDNGNGVVATNKTRPTKELITAAFKVLEAQKKITKEEFKEKYQKGQGISKLTEVELTDILNTVKTDFPHLSL